MRNIDKEEEEYEYDLCTYSRMAPQRAFYIKNTEENGNTNN